jgi:hypothetical protein
MSKTRSLLTVLAPLGLALVGGLSSCKGQEAYIKTDQDRDVIDAKRGGIQSYDIAVKTAVGELLLEHSSRIHAVDLWVAFVGIENKSSEELGEFREAIYENIDTALVNSRNYRNVSKRYVDTALREIGNPRVEDMFLPKTRTAFVKAIGELGAVPNYLLFAKVTTKTSEDSKLKERVYQLTLEMVDAQSGEIVAKKTGDATKQYVK